MGRTVKRVPMDFNHPLNQIWPGYILTPEKAIELFNPVWANKEDLDLRSICANCSACDLPCEENQEHCYVHNEKHRAIWYYEPPVGEGYQLWETTSEGSPCTPVFTTLDELCEYAEKNVSTFADIMATKEE